MIRERRSKEKLQQYYQRFIQQGIIDPNVHPWVAESWQKSQSEGVPRDAIRSKACLTKEELCQQRIKHAEALNFLEGLYQEVRGHFNKYNLSFLLLDEECYALKSYALPFFQKNPGELEGVRLTETDIGTSSIAIAKKQQIPFLVFGPEMWIEDGQAGDACSAPVVVDGKLQYILTLVSVDQAPLPSGAMETLLLMMKYSMEKHLEMLRRLEEKHAILNAVPLAAYYILPGGQVTYANKNGHSRLLGAKGVKGTELPDLKDVVLNYKHTLLAKGFLGIPSYNKEMTWITSHNTYEDITTVLPLYSNNEVNSVVAISFSIEDLEMLGAHAVGYTARYNLSSMVGKSHAFLRMKEKASRVARGNRYLLLQGEPGTGKQRLARGIHQEGLRAGGPLITLKCKELSPELLDYELFGRKEQGESEPGKLELAKCGTLFLDEVEKVPIEIANKLVDWIVCHHEADPITPSGVRIIAASDSDLKRLVEKGKFSPELYELIAKPIVRVPALRTRQEDISLLAEHIIQELAEQHGMGKKIMSKNAIALLEGYEWPGNIKQLQTVIEDAFFHTSDCVIEEHMINLPQEAGIETSWKDDREAFLNSWKEARGNISRLSQTLGVSRVTLYRYLKKYGLEKD